jgi:hypothetical protein
MIAFQDLQVGAADPGQMHFNENFPGAGLRPGQFLKL